MSTALDEHASAMTGGDPLEGLAEAYHEPATPPLDEPVTAEPAPASRRRPGPPPNPNSKRSQLRAKKAARAAAPRKRPARNTPSGADHGTPASAYEQGALAILGFAARPLAAAGLAMGLAAATMPTQPDGRPTPRAVQLDKHAQALSLDSLTLAVHGPELAQGIATIAPNVPWMAAVLEKAAKISPLASMAEAFAGLALQMASNHGFIPASPVLGTLTPAQLRKAAGLDFPEPEAT